MHIIAYQDYNGPVPHPLPREVGSTEDELLDALKKSNAQKRSDAQYAESLAEKPESFQARMAAMAGTAATKTKLIAADVDEKASTLKREQEVKGWHKKMTELFPMSTDDAPIFSVACSAWDARAGRELEGTMFLTAQKLLFYSEQGQFTLQWTDVLSLQKAAQLAVEAGHPPFFLPIPHPAVAWNALQVYCLRGRLYNFYHFKPGLLGGVAATQKQKTRALALALVHSDRQWRQAVSVAQLLEERSDYAKKKAGFVYEAADQPQSPPPPEREETS